MIGSPFKGVQTTASIYYLNRDKNLFSVTPSSRERQHKTQLPETPFAPRYLAVYII